jgi:hypothetical protein
LDISVLGPDLDISVLGPGHFGTDQDISVLGTGQFRTWTRQYSLLTTIVWYLLIVNIFVLVVLYRPAVENQKIKCNEPMGYTPISYVIGKRNDGTLRIMMP